MIHFVPFDDRHFPHLLSWLTTEQALCAWGVRERWTAPLTETQLNSYLCESMTVPSAGMLFMVQDEAGNPVGHGALTSIDRNQQTALLSHCVVAPAVQGSSMHDEIVAGLLSVGFRDLGCWRIEAEILVTDATMQRALAHAGFEQEGGRRQAVQANCRFVDTSLWAILRPRWEGGR